MEKLFEKELRLAHKHHQEEIERLVRCSQRCALHVVFNKFMERSNMIEDVLYSQEGLTIWNSTYGERFKRMTDIRCKALEKSSFLCEAAAEVLNQIKNFS